jgi:uncharacterized protein (DUF1684 family)
MPQGNLALINTAWMCGKPGEWETVWMAQGEWSAVEAGDKGIRLRATANDGVSVNGSLIEGETTVFARDTETPSSITFADGKTGTVIVNEEGIYALRVWDENSDDISNFGGIDAFDYDPAWVITGTFTPIEGGREVGVSQVQSQGATKSKVIPGDISFTVDGTDYSPLAFVEGRALMIVFSDATSGDSTYSVGRFLLCAPNPDGSITLDFNRAYLPPCAFNYNFNCPIPPDENRFPFAVTAGEKNVLNREGSLLH